MNFEESQLAEAVRRAVSNIVVDYDKMPLDIKIAIYDQFLELIVPTISALPDETSINELPSCEFIFREVSLDLFLNHLRALPFLDSLPDAVLLENISTDDIETFSRFLLTITHLTFQYASEETIEMKDLTLTSEELDLELRELLREENK